MNGLVDLKEVAHRSSAHVRTLCWYSLSAPILRLAPPSQAKYDSLLHIASQAKYDSLALCWSEPESPGNPVIGYTLKYRPESDDHQGGEWVTALTPTDGNFTEFQVPGLTVRTACSRAAVHGIWVFACGGGLVMGGAAPGCDGGGAWQASTVYGVSLKAHTEAALCSEESSDIFKTQKAVKPGVGGPFSAD